MEMEMAIGIAMGMDMVIDNVDMDLDMGMAMAMVMSYYYVKDFCDCLLRLILVSDIFEHEVDELRPSLSCIDCIKTLLSINC